MVVVMRVIVGSLSCRRLPDVFEVEVGVGKIVGQEGRSWPVVDAVLRQLHECFLQGCQLRRKFVEGESSVKSDVTDFFGVEPYDGQGSVLLSSHRGSVRLHRLAEFVGLDGAYPDELLGTLRNEV